MKLKPPQAILVSSANGWGSAAAREHLRDLCQNKDLCIYFFGMQALVRVSGLVCISDSNISWQPCDAWERTPGCRTRAPHTLQG